MPKQACGQGLSRIGADHHLSLENHLKQAYKPFDHDRPPEPGQNNLTG